MATTSRRYNERLNKPRQDSQNETPESRQQHIEHRRVTYRQSRQSESAEDREQRLECRRVTDCRSRQNESAEDREQRLECRRVTDRRSRQNESAEDREQRLQRRRDRYRLTVQQRTMQVHENQLQARRDRYRLLIQRERDEDRQVILRSRRECEHPASTHVILSDTEQQVLAANFKTYLLMSLEYCNICQCMMFMDKAKTVSFTILDNLNVHAQTDCNDTTCTDMLRICSKCNTQVTKGHWPQWAPDNGLTPDVIPTVLAALTSDEVRIISMVIPFLKVVVLPGGQYGEEGSVIHFPFPINHVYNQLPHCLSDCEVLLSSVGIADRTTFQSLLGNIDTEHVYQALQWLKLNNPLYESVTNVQLPSVAIPPVNNSENDTINTQPLQITVEDDTHMIYTINNHMITNTVNTPSIDTNELMQITVEDDTHMIYTINNHMITNTVNTPSIDTNELMQITVEDDTHMIYTIITNTVNTSSIDTNELMKITVEDDTHMIYTINNHMITNTVNTSSIDTNELMQITVEDDTHMIYTINNHMITNTVNTPSIDTNELMQITVEDDTHMIYTIDNHMITNMCTPNELTTTNSVDTQSMNSNLHDDIPNHTLNTYHNTTDVYTESCIIQQNYVEPNITITELLQRQNSAPQLPFPRIISSPINTFHNKNLEALAFPVLYPYGRFDLGYERSKRLTDLQYFQCRLYHKDPRWRNNTLWLFWALNNFEMRKLQNEISIVSRIMKQNKQPITAGDIRNPTENAFINSSYMFMRNIRGTPAYWKDQLLARINSLGPPTFFITLTANDMHWPELFKLIDSSLTIDHIKQMSSSEKLKLLKHHPLQAVMFFERRLDFFINNVIKSKCKPLGEVKDYWMRIEFQMRGSPHIHSFWWIKGAPNLDTVEGRQLAPEFIDKYISTTYPNEGDTQLYHLVDTLQVHSHSPTCYKYNNRTCRFDFPRPTSEITRLRINSDPGSAARFYVTKRQECDKWVNAYNPTILRSWEANMDIQMVGSQYGAAMYVCMYVSKAEPKRLKYALHETIQNIPSDATLRKRLSLIGATVLTHRQISVQEAIYRLGGFKLVRSTRSTVTVPCNTPQHRNRILKPQSQLSQLSDTSTDIFHPGIIEYYEDRPDGPDWDQLSLASFATTYTTSNKSTISGQKLKSFDLWLNKRKKSACLRILHFNNTSDEYYYGMLMLFLPFRKVSELTVDGETARDAFIRQHHCLDIHSSPYLHIAQDIQAAIVRIQLQNALTPLDIAAQVAPTLHTLEETEEHFHDNSHTDGHECNYGWLQTIATVNSNIESQAENIVDTSLSWAQTFTTTMSDTQYYQALSFASPDQKHIIDKVYQYNRDRINNHATNQLLLFVTGGAGTGKSFVIRTIHEMLNRINQHNPVLLTAPTGIAAYNIGGVTLHSAFCLPVEHHKTATYIPLRAEKLQNLRNKFQNIYYVIIDEISMVSCQNLAFIHKRLCDIKDTTHDPSVLFGGLSILAFGDLFQLKPVHGSYIFDTRKPESYLWHHFTPAILTTNHRQAGDKTWAEILNRIRVGKPTTSDTTALLQRTSIDTTTPPFDTALRIFPTRKQVQSYNSQRLADLTSSQPTILTYTIIAQDTIISAPGYLTDEQVAQSKSKDSSDTAGLVETLNLANGSRVMLLRNVYTDEGLVNGAQGTVQGIEWGNDSVTMPRGIYVLFDNPLIGQSLKNCSNDEHHNSILIRPITANFYGKFNVNWSRTQIPLTPCWATTIHKVQGITLSHAVIDIGSSVFTSGMSYVALSRIQNIAGLAIEAVDPNKLKASDMVLTEMDRIYQQLQKSE